MTGHDFFLMYMGVFFSAFLLFPCLVLMHFLMPRIVLDRYWKQPYFRTAELVLFTDTVYALLRTVMLMWVIAFPRFGRKRGITEAGRLVPWWYRAAAGLFSVWIVGAAAVIVVTTVGIFIYGYAVGDPVPLAR